jgi:two-component system, chemotaxis family, chemotaxis protein CheY
MLAFRSALSSPLPPDSPLAKRLAACSFLVVDDSPFVRRTVRDMLHSFSARQVTEAADGFQALAEARRLPPQVIILDWVLPGVSGAEFLRVLRESSLSPAPHADVIVITAQPTLSMVIEAQRFDVGAIIRKPFAPKAVLERLAHSSLRINRIEPILKPARAGTMVTRRLPRLPPSPSREAPERKAAADPLADFAKDDTTWAI